MMQLPFSVTFALIPQAILAQVRSQIAPQATPTASRLSLQARVQAMASLDLAAVMLTTCLLSMTVVTSSWKPVVPKLKCGNAIQTSAITQYMLALLLFSWY